MRKHERSRCSKGDSDQSHSQSLPYHHAKNVRLRRSQRHADANFLSSVLHEIRQQPIYAY